MTRKTLAADPAQLGFDLFLVEADTINKAVAYERTHGHLPGTMGKALPFYRDLIERHHAAMLAEDRFSPTNRVGRGWLFLSHG